MLSEEQKGLLLEIFKKPQVEVGEGIEVHQCAKEEKEDMHDSSDSEHPEQDGNAPPCAMQ